MKNNKTYRLALLALFIALEIVLVVTPLGIIPLGFIQITTMHIPAILAGILLGRKAGATIGLVFGLASTTYAVLAPSPASLFFTPFYSIGQYSGNIYSLVIAIVPRVLLGYFAGVLDDLFTKLKLPLSLNTILTSIIASVLHTAMVMGLIFIFFKDQYVGLFGGSVTTIWAFILATLLSNGIAEAVFAGLLDWPIVAAVTKISRKED